MATKNEGTPKKQVKKELKKEIDKVEKKFKMPEMGLWQKVVLAVSVTLAMVQTVRMWRGVFKRLARS